MNTYTHDTPSIRTLKNAKERDQHALLALLPEIDHSPEMEALFVATAARYAQTILDLQHAALLRPKTLTIYASTGEPAIDQLVSALMDELIAEARSQPEPDITFD